MALYLAKMNWLVSVFERHPHYGQRPHPKEGSTLPSRRSYNIVLTDRGLQALQQAEVKLPKDQHILLQGNVRHSSKGAKFSSQFSNAVSINRETLAQILVQAGYDRFPQQISYHFEHHLETINCEKQLVYFNTPTSRKEETFNLLVGADGVSSQVRGAMTEQLDEFSYQQNRDQMMFKVCQLGPASKLPDADENWGQCFHTWPSQQPTTLLAPPSPDHSLTGVLILPQIGDWTFEKLNTHQDVEKLFQDKFPDVFEGQSLPLPFVQDLLTQKAMYGGITTTCSTLHGGRNIVLIGDSAHSVWPSLGQGCNVALESCQVLATIMAQEKGDLATILHRYTTDRKPDVDAIGRLSEQGFGGNRRAATRLFFTKILALMLLNRILPSFFQKPALFQISNAKVRFSEIERLMQIQNRQVSLITWSLLAIVLGISGFTLAGIG